MSFKKGDLVQYMLGPARTNPVIGFGVILSDEVQTRGVEQIMQVYWQGDLEPCWLYVSHLRKANK